MVASAHRYVRLPARRTAFAGRRARNEVANRVAQSGHWLRRLKFLRFGALVTTAAAISSCGNVTFVDAPFAPRQIDLAYSTQEDVTAIRWWLSAADPDPDVRFELLDA